jgi:hypothetical protein
MLKSTKKKVNNMAYSENEIRYIISGRVNYKSYKILEIANGYSSGKPEIYVKCSIEGKEKHFIISCQELETIKRKIY